jgi:hypothetical protein
VLTGATCSIVSADGDADSAEGAADAEGNGTSAAAATSAVSAGSAESAFKWRTARRWTFKAQCPSAKRTIPKDTALTTRNRVSGKRAADGARERPAERTVAAPDGASGVDAIA